MCTNSSRYRARFGVVVRAPHANRAEITVAVNGNEKNAQTKRYHDDQLIRPRARPCNRNITRKRVHTSRVYVRKIDNDQREM